MSANDQADPRKPTEKVRHASRETRARPHSNKAAKDVSNALRSVYDDTLREDIPDDFRDLLDKLR